LVAGERAGRCSIDALPVTGDRDGRRVAIVPAVDDLGADDRECGDVHGFFEAYGERLADARHRVEGRR
jgi:hypothetical protein